MIARIAIACVLVAGCGDPPLKLVYRVADTGGGQSCGTSDCGRVPMMCASVLHVRILSPSNPMLPHVVVCEEIPVGQRDMCAVGGVDLPDDVVLPRETLEVQVTVWPRSAIFVGEGIDEVKDCGRVSVDFDLQYGFPTSPGPAFGGRGFYHPGDEETVVTLGCTNVSAVNSCSAGVNVTAGVLDFESLPFSVSTTTADDLALHIGEPKEDTEMMGTIELLPGSLDELTRQGESAVWAGAVDAAFEMTACLHVDEGVPQSTPTIRCKRVSPNPPTVEISGVRVTRETLDEILVALGLPGVPNEGMTLGIIVDSLGIPAEGVTVTSTGGTIVYLNNNRTGIAPGTATTSSGIFVSLDAPYGSEFNVPPMFTSGVAIGGNVAGKVTVVYFDVEQIGG